jgi:alpha-tubulin suppressor-like RCC1 family protein
MLPLSARPSVALYVESGTVCAKDDRDEVWCVGENARWPVFFFPGEQRSSKTPVKHGTANVSGLQDFDPYYGCALAEGRVFCWRGVRDPEPLHYFKLPSLAIKHSSGLDHQCVVLDDGAVWCRGSNEFGQLGNEAPKPGSENEEAPLEDHRWDFVRSQLSVKARDVAVGYSATCALAEDGAVWCWGENFAGEVGNAVTCASDDNCTPGPVWLPTKVEGLPKVRHLSVGGHSSCAVDTTGRVWCWGANLLRNFPNPPGDGCLMQPTLIPLPEKMATVETDAYQACALSQTAHVYCWGSVVSRHQANPVRIQLDCGG